MHAQDIGSMVSGVYGQKSGIKTARSRGSKGAGGGGNVYQAYMRGKGSYEARMAQWGQYCDDRGDGDAVAGAFASGASSFIPVVGGVVSAVGGLVEREGTKSENRCHYYRTAYMTQYERARTEKDNEEFLTGVRAEIAVLREIQETQVTPEVVEEIIQRTVALQREMLLKEIEAAAKAKNQAPPAAATPPVPAKPVPATPEGKDVPSAQAPAPLQPKAEAPKPKEATPSVSPSKDDPKDLPMPKPIPTPDMAKVLLKHPDIAFDPARNK